MTSWEFGHVVLRLFADWLILMLMLRGTLVRSNISSQHPIMLFSVGFTQWILSPFLNCIRFCQPIFCVVIAIFSIALWVNIFTLATHPLLDYDFFAWYTWIGILLLTCIDLIRQLCMLTTVLIIASWLFNWLYPVSVFTGAINNLVKQLLKCAQPIRMNRLYWFGLIVVLLIQLIGMPVIQGLEKQSIALLQLTVK
ncbi:MAG: hypothetical protein IPK86_01540 [Neisseriales bacterium]|nr:MAG: hypothetical protein IPK86_01540 [Neisseriales bacterium]